MCHHFFLLIYEVSFHLMKSYFCYLILKTTCSVTTAYGNVLNKLDVSMTHAVIRNTQSLYHAQSFVLFTLNFKTALYHLTSNLFTLRTKKNYKLRVVFRSLQFLPCIYSFTVRKPLTSNDVNNSFDKIISNYRYSIFSGAVCCPKYSHYHAHKRKFLLKSSNVEQ